MKSLRKILIGLAFAITLMGGLWMAVPTYAQTDSLATVGTASGLGTEDIRLVVARIIRTFLTVLGVIAVIIVIYGGYTYMTAGGEEEKVEKAKKILINGGIGLAVILLSWAITSFIISALMGAVGGDGSATYGSSSRGSGLGGGSVTSFAVAGIRPEGDVSIRNVQVSVTFSRALDTTTVEGNLVVTNAFDGEIVEGTTTASGSRATFTPTEVCPAPNETRHCFAENTQYTVTVDSGIHSSADLALSCVTGCTANFTTGTLIDTDNPVADLSAPDSGDRITVDSSTGVQAEGTDDSELATADFSIDDAVAFDSISASGDDLSDVLFDSTWYTDGLTEGTRYKVNVLVVDIAGNTDTDTVTVRATSATCSDDLLNGDETTVDAGGSCGVAEGGPCTDASECASSLDCVEGICTATPEITAVSPASGAPGTFVTISGTGFGSGTGTIEFTSADGTALVEAEIPSCAEGWSDTEVIVELPETAGDGPITLTTAQDLVDATDDDNGSLIAGFDVNEIVRPNLCRLSPSSTYISRAVTLTGTNFGQTQADSAVYFDTTVAGSYTSWSDTSLKVTSPSVAAGDYDVNVTVDGVTSNSINFTTLSPETTSPTISYVSPEDGGIGQYVTIAGSGFGGSVGAVYFDNQSSGYRALGSDDFPAACANSYWSDSEITIIVPENYTNDEDVETTTHDVMVVTRSGEDSNTVEFTISTAEPTAGICALLPDSGLPGDEITAYGEHLGTTAGTAAFYNEASATIGTDDWGDTSVVMTVPALAQTGAMSLTTSSAVESNSLNFEITSDSSDGAAAPIGAAYAWRFSTGDIPETPELYTECSDTRISAVPNNQFTSGGVCTNAMVFGEFNMLMQESSFVDGSSVKIQECADANCAASGLVTVAGSITISHSTGADGSGQSSFSWRPTSGYNGGDFKTATTYQVTLTTAITASAGLSLANDEVWKFTTSATSEPCEVEEVRVSPSEATITADDETSEFLALPSYGCVVLDSSTYSWAWDVNDSYAAISEGDCADSTGDDCAVATPLAEGVTAVTATEDASDVSGSGTLTIDYTDPYVLNYWPGCDEACVNAQVGASFNIKMEPSSVQASGAAQLYSCENELCLSLTLVSDSAYCLDQTNCDSIYFSTGNLLTDTFYRVMISGEVVSTSGVPLTRLNYGADYSWVFSTKESSEECAVSRATIEPNNVTLSAVGQTQSFVGEAFGVQDDCSTSGQRLNSYSYDWAWENPIIDDTDVAYWYTTSSTLLNVNPDGITAGCTAGCISGGSSTYYAVCGDGIIGTGEDCDDGNTTSLDGCSATCLAEGSAACSKICSSTGNTCTADSDCQDTCVTSSTTGVDVSTCSLSGATCTTDASCAYYSATCDFTGTSCCGNGLTEADSNGGGEECDDSDASSGDGCSATCINEGSKSVSATCGNSSVGYVATTGGEDCDDGNKSNGDGCSSICLNEGSSAQGDVHASCGDGVIDAPYESCDDSNNDDLDGCSSICLREGSHANYADFGSNGLCGDGITNKNSTTSAGEDCDSASDEGCGSDCLWLGSSTDYATPSVCGDGVTGTGELAACESSAGDSYIDPLQLAVISNDAGLQVDTDTHLATSTIRTQVSTATAEATLSLSCVADLDADCPDIGTKHYGVADNSCCMERPEATLFPNGTNTCRNAALYGIFTQEMSSKSFGSSDNNNFYIELDPTTTDSGSCPVDYDTVAMIGVPEPESFLARLWHSIVSFFVVDSVEAQSTASGLCDAGQNAGAVCTSNGDCPSTLTTGATCSLNDTCSLVVCNGDPAGDDAVESSSYNDQQCIIDCSDTLTCAAGDADSDGYCDGTTSVGAGLLCGSGTVDCTDTYYCDGVSQSGTIDGPGTETCVGIEPPITGCFLPVTSITQTALSDGTYKVYFNHSVALEADATYTIHVDGDTVGDAVFEGATSKYGVEMDGDTEQDFSTGSAICTLDDIDVNDSDSSSPNVFSLANESHIFNASTYSFTTGARTEVVSLPGIYAWTWQDWLEDSGGTVFDVATSDEDQGTIEAVGEDGSGSVVAQATITDFPGGEFTCADSGDACSTTADCASGESCDGGTVTGSAKVTAFICEVPWPNPDTQSFPFVDDATNTVSGAAIGAGWMNFSTYYCQDAGEDGTSDDYQSVSVVASTPASTSVLKEYFFIYGDGSGDAIGVRIAKNEDYLNPSAWYAAQGFAGDPTIEEHDGFEALRDGRTLYVSGPNLSGTTLYPNMYVISYNEGASESVVSVFNQMVSHIALATNADDINLCYSGMGTSAVYTSEVCSSDADCDVSGEVCGSIKDKLARDVTRLTDLKEVKTDLSSYGSANRLCSETTDRTCNTSSDCPDGESCDVSVPTLEAGSYVRALSSSAWPSWSAALTDALESDVLPADPLNFYEGCGASPYASYDASTCVNQSLGEYLCPENSFVYHYRSVGPFDYELAAELEYNDASWAYDIDNDTTDGYVVMVGGDLTGTSDGFQILPAYCDADAYGASTTCGDGIVGSGEVCETGDVSSTACDTTDTDPDLDGSIRSVCNSTCTDYEASSTATCEPADCGNGSIESGEECDDGTNNGAYGYCGNDCTWTTSYYCGDGNVASGETCDCNSVFLSGSHATGTCAAGDNLGGDCSADTDCPASPLSADFCALSTSCRSVTCIGDARGDATSSIYNGEQCIMDCDSSITCAEGDVDGDGYCDGTTSRGSGILCGSGSVDCSDTYYCDGAYFGSEIDEEDPGFETCTLPSTAASGRSYGGGLCTVLNGSYSASQYDTCASDCSGPGPYCGDGDVTGSEECDGNTDEYSGKLCSAGANEGAQCDDDTDCLDGATCGSYAGAYLWADECAVTSVCIDGLADSMGTACDADADCDSSTDSGDGVCSDATYQTTRVKTCADDGAGDEYCTWNESSWQTISCTAEANCGNGSVEGDEECDDGNTDSTDACTNACTVSYCGDGYVEADVENCDEGTGNGVLCESAYDSTCTYCTSDCNYAVTSGTFCGDGVINGDEFCDASDVPAYYFNSTYGAIGGTCTGSGTTSIADSTDLDGDGNVTESFTYTCTLEIGICNGGANAGEYCDASADCGTGYECAFETCDSTCNNTCPATFSSEDILMRTNQLGASRTSSVELSSSSAVSSVITANAVTMSIPICDAVSGLTVDIDDTSREYPDVEVMFVLDRSQSMDTILTGTCSGNSAVTCTSDMACTLRSAGTCNTQTRLDVLREAVTEAAAELYAAYDEVSPQTMKIGFAYIGGKHGSDDDSSGLYERVNDSEDDEFDDFVSLNPEAYESVLDTSLTTVLSAVDSKVGTPIYESVYDAMNAFSSTADAKYLVIFTDGDIYNNDLDKLSCDELSVSTAACSMTGQTIDDEAYVAKVSTLTAYAKNQDISIFTAVFTNNTCDIAQMQHWSSMDCVTNSSSSCADWKNEGDVTCTVPDDGVTYAYSATTAAGLTEMYQSIVDSIVNFNFSLTFDGDTAYTAVPSGNDAVLNLPETFVCDGSDEQSITMRVSWNGGGTIGLDDLSANACVP